MRQVRPAQGRQLNTAIKDFQSSLMTRNPNLLPWLKARDAFEAALQKFNMANMI
jgi:hypothetical protein